MTGEITLRGKVLPVGGIKEKVLAALRAGIRTVILPRKNGKDLEEVPPEVQARLRFHYVDSVDEVLPLALDRGRTAPSRRAPRPRSPDQRRRGAVLPPPLPVQASVGYSACCGRSSAISNHGAFEPDEDVAPGRHARRVVEAPIGTTAMPRLASTRGMREPQTRQKACAKSSRLGHLVRTPARPRRGGSAAGRPGERFDA